ncbi:uncharacterized protein LOC141641211 [Silene latifolia]|uniref:uncharacterized protein LOC141641211 n=1 Tax=Silene latifolia TaxID=37657 RepID=UPI003D781A6F
MRNCLATCELMDVAGQGPLFTWTNKQPVGSRVYSRINRVLVNSQWLTCLSNNKAIFLPEGHFDHCPCIISFNNENRLRKGQFKYFNMWSKAACFLTLVEEWWSNPVQGTKIFRVVTKLKMLEKPLKGLNKDLFHDIERNDGIASRMLYETQVKLRADPCNPALISEELRARDVSSHLEEARRDFQTQKAKTT